MGDDTLPSRLGSFDSFRNEACDISVENKISGLPTRMITYIGAQIEGDAEHTTHHQGAAVFTDNTSYQTSQLVDNSDWNLKTEIPYVIDANMLYSKPSTVLYMSLAILIILCALFFGYGLYLMMFRMEGHDVGEIRRILGSYGFSVKLKNRKTKRDGLNSVDIGGNVNTDSKQEERHPRHIAVIMDGNRRFGMKMHADPLQGHWVGGQNLIDFTQWCMEAKVQVLTVYAFSTENWNRDPKEVAILMNIFAKYADNFRKEALSRNIKVCVISSDDSKLPCSVKNAINSLEMATNQCTAFLLNLCISYGGRAEIVNACKSIVSQVKSGDIDVNDINEDCFSSNLSTAKLPDPEILIRTSGEFRLSNFLLWQLAYTEMFFIDKFWPEVNRDDLLNIFKLYNERHRRFGK